MLQPARCYQHGAAGPWQVVTRIAGSKRRSLLMAGDDEEMFMTRSLNVTPKTTTAKKQSKLVRYLSCHSIRRTVLRILIYSMAVCFKALALALRPTYGLGLDNITDLWAVTSLALAIAMRCCFASLLCLFQCLQPLQQ